MQVNFGIQSATGQWHDSQCMLWLLEVGER